jgi:hypothetical protein
VGVTQSIFDSIVAYESDNIDESNAWSSRDLLRTGRIDRSCEESRTGNIDGNTRFDVTRYVLRTLPLAHSAWSLPRGTIILLSVHFDHTAPRGVTAKSDQSILIDSFRLLQSDLYQSLIAARSQGSPRSAGILFRTEAILLSAGHIASYNQARSQVFVSDSFAQSSVLTGSVFFSVVDEGLEQEIENAAASVAAGTSAGFGVLASAALMILLLKKRSPGENDVEEGIEYETEAHDVTIEEKNSESSDDEWDVDEFDHVIESTFVNGQEPSHVMYDLSDQFFDTVCSES